MNLLAIFSLLLSGYFVSPFNLRELDNDTLQQKLSTAGLHSRITNGIPAAHNQFPSIVGLRIYYPNGRNFICGGSLIGHRWVLTAAHCTENCSNVYVHMGSLFLNQSPTVLQAHRRDGDIIEHKHHNGTTFMHDIAVIKIPAVQFSITTVRLPQRVPDFPPYDDVDTDFAGWGHTSDSIHHHSNTLQYFKFKTISNEECARTYGPKIYAGKLCTATPRRIGACHGDSGGPLMLLNTNVQIGIFSFLGSRGCEEGQPNAFTRVDQYLDWIRDNTRLPV